MNLKGKKALVTGGTSGLGLEIVKLLLENECEVITCGTNPERIKKLEGKERLKAMKCDITKLNEVIKLADKIDDLDILVNNAGVRWAKPIGRFTNDEISQMLDVNIKGTIFMTQEFIPKLTKEHRTYIVNVVSTSGLKTRAGSSVYCASKWGQRGFTDSVKEELLDTNIRVVGFYPGGMKTDLFHRSGDNKNLSVYMDPTEVAKTLIHLLEKPDDMYIDHIVLNRADN